MKDRRWKQVEFTNLFGKATSRWTKYSEYDAVQHENGDWYIMPTKDAMPSVYDPIEKAGARNRKIYSWRYRT